MSARAGAKTSGDDAVEGFLRHLGGERNLSPNTVAAYRRDLGQFADFCHRMRIDPVRAPIVSLLQPS